MAKDKTTPDDEFIDELDDRADDTAKSGTSKAKLAKSDEKNSKKDKSGKKSRNAGKKVSKFFKDSKGEFTKIIWPSRKTVVRNTSVTIAMCAVVGVAVSLFDYGLSALIRLFTNT